MCTVQVSKDLKGRPGGGLGGGSAGTASWGVLLRCRGSPLTHEMQAPFDSPIPLLRAALRSLTGLFAAAVFVATRLETT